jgi:hypothetical protein
VILQKASNRFLDSAIAMRLPSISARALLNMLARAERLGYDASDIVEDEPAYSSPPILRSQNPATVQTQPNATRVERIQQAQSPLYECSSCGRGFWFFSHYKHVSETSNSKRRCALSCLKNESMVHNGLTKFAQSILPNSCAPDLIMGTRSLYASTVARGSRANQAFRTICPTMYAEILRSSTWVNTHPATMLVRPE